MVSVKAVDNQRVATTKVSNNGVAVFDNVPNTPIVVEALATGARYAHLATTGDVGTVTLRLAVIGEPSPIDNNDFSQGAPDWNTQRANVSIQPHMEGQIATVAHSREPCGCLRTSRACFTCDAVR